MTTDYRRTINSCFIGLAVQAILNNFTPLLFLTFSGEFGVSLSRITLLVTLNFGVQLVVDLIAAGVVDKIGYRAAALISHVLSAAGLAALAVLPGLFADPFAGLLTATVIGAVGGGLLEVILSPMVEACPSKHKARTMSMLHSFYCWGHVAVVLLSTLFFALWGTENWRWLALIWACVPIINGISFVRAPIAPLIAEGERGMSLRELLGSGTFWLLIVLMICSGASEQSVSQWASTFAERALGVSKSVGDLAGPMVFAVLMGLSRLLYGKLGERIRLRRFMAISAVLCAAAMLIMSLTGSPIAGLCGVGLCGFSVGIFWPGTCSLAAKALRGGGTVMFALLALAGDVGCSLGPTVAGLVSGAFGDDLRAGTLASLVFPAMLFLLLLRRKNKNDTPKL